MANSHSKFTCKMRIINFVNYFQAREVAVASVFKALPRRQGGGGSPCLRSLLSPPRRRLGDKAVVDRLASPYRFKNIADYNKQASKLMLNW